MPKKILIVDDDADIRVSTGSVLRKRGYEVLSAPNGYEALQVLKHQRPDLILVDVLMPVMDGYSFYKEIKSQRLTEDIPILIITGRGKMEDTFKVAGVDGFIAKPFSPEQLLTEVEHILLADTTRKAGSTTDGAGERKRVLVVTAERLLGESIMNQAIRAGYTSELSLTSSEAIAKIVKLVPHVCVIDVFIDDMRLAEFVDVIRKLPQMDNKILIGFYYYAPEDLNQEAVRKRLLQIDELTKLFLRSGGDEFLGRYQPQTFLKMILEKTQRSRNYGG